MFRWNSRGLACCVTKPALPVTRSTNKETFFGSSRSLPQRKKVTSPSHECIQWASVVHKRKKSRKSVTSEHLSTAINSSILQTNGSQNRQADPPPPPHWHCNVDHLLGDSVYRHKIYFPREWLSFRVTGFFPRLNLEINYLENCIDT